MSSIEKTADKRPTAFVSWAHGDDAWERTVLDFATAMRVVGGVDVDLDLWHATDHENWTTYGPTGIRESDFVLVTVDRAYRERWEGTNEAGVGAGAAREAAAIKAIFEKDQTAFLRRVKVVVLPGATKDDIPDELLGGAERFEVREFDAPGLEGLLRALYDKPLDSKPPLGPAPALPPRFVADVQEATAAAAPGGDQPSGETRAADDGEILRVRLEQIEQIRADIDEAAAASDAKLREQLEQEEAGLRASLEALDRSASRSAEADQGAAAVEATPVDPAQPSLAEPTTQPSTIESPPAAPTDEQSSVRLHDDVLNLLRQKDTIGLDVLLRAERRGFEKAVDAATPANTHDVPTAEHAKEAHSELLPVLERRLAGWLPLVAHEAGLDLWREEIDRLVDWRDRQPHPDGYVFWPGIGDWTVWWLSYAVGAAAVRGRRWSALTPPLRANVRNRYGGQSPLVESVPGEAGDAIGKASHPAPEGKRWTAPWWEALKRDLFASAVLHARYPELVDPEDELVAALSAFDLLVSISLGLINHPAAAHWAMASEGGKRLALQLHKDAAIQAQIAEAVGLAANDFMEQAAAALQKAQAFPMTFPDRGAIGLLRAGVER